MVQGVGSGDTCVAENKIEGGDWERGAHNGGREEDSGEEEEGVKEKVERCAMRRLCMSEGGKRRE